MTMPENTFHEIKVYKPHLRLRLGDVVAFKEDPKQREMVVCDFLAINYRDNRDDYIVKGISSQGKPVQKSFKEIELLKID
jgi:hypothetical protein